MGGMQLDNQFFEKPVINSPYEYLYDKPYEYKSVVRVAGPFTAKSLSPHRELEVGENDDLADKVADMRSHYGTGADLHMSDDLKNTGTGNLSGR